MKEVRQVLQEIKPNIQLRVDFLKDQTPQSQWYRIMLLQ
jgi:hypothetical protein